MSVVNQMLRDLEQRQTSSDNTQTVYRSAQPPRTAMPFIIIGCCFSVIVLVSLFAPSLSEVLLKGPAQGETHTPTDKLPVMHSNDRGFVLNKTQPTVAVSTTNKVNLASNTRNNEDLRTSSNSTDLQHPPAAMSVARTATESMPANKSANPDPQTVTGMMVVQSAQDADTRVSLLQDKARLALQMNQFSDATEHLANLLKLAPEKNDMRLLLGRIYFQQNRIEQALTTLQNTATETDIGMEFIAFRAQLLTQTGEHRAAIADYNRLSESQPNNVKWLLGSAVAYDQLQAYNEAIIAYENIALNPNLPDNISTFVTQRLGELRTLI
ncbi:tetratricopeptide repeat protein [Opacimonas viscosa]|uniref:Tetratricopeptide repeat protein n=1 Tax=Opacimonas viscosa TaxID=2961944 RepID=A0AA41X3G8_9ALTE|nr:tetratricopeptide repeat protein [Opacimonas viscosa]MCP3429676.1 tetratricopeptide repeat protein [Opacimonas viscosa]